jgi:HupE / UreJ protein
MNIFNQNKNSCQFNSWQLFAISIIFILLSANANNLYAHQSPTSMVLLDVSPNKVAMELQLPITEFELAFGHGTIKKPERFIDDNKALLTEYLKAHIHAYILKNNPWVVDVFGLEMQQGISLENGIAYWEVVVKLILTPNTNENTRNFILDYDVIIHQVVTHTAFVSIRTDWENGKIEDKNTEPQIIKWNSGENVIYPLEINLEKGNTFKGFASMLQLGMQHIKEGTDHLLFLIVLLLPSMLLIQKNNWGKYGGTKNALKKLFKIVTAFTIGHSITLLIGALGFKILPTQLIEILIAFSILITAIHAIKPIFSGKETYIAIGFGLIHGLAFASVLSNLHLGANAMVLSILGFNIGIELMQILIILMIVPWLILLSQHSIYKFVRSGIACLAALAAIGWVFERISGKSNFITSAIQNYSNDSIYLIAILAIFSLLVYYWPWLKNIKSFI